MKQVVVVVPLNAGVFELCALALSRGKFVPRAGPALVEVVVVEDIIILLSVLDERDLILEVVFLERAVEPCRRVRISLPVQEARLGLDVVT